MACWSLGYSSDTHKEGRTNTVPECKLQENSEGQADGQLPWENVSAPLCGRNAEGNSSENKLRGLARTTQQVSSCTRRSLNRSHIPCPFQ